MSKKLLKREAINKIEDFFKNVTNKNLKEVKKIKNLAASFYIPLKDHRKAFCKRCLSPYTISKIRIKNGLKSVTCEKCGFVSRWKVKIS